MSHNQHTAESNLTERESKDQSVGKKGLRGALSAREQTVCKCLLRL
jgi:hypothetical protein